MKWSYGITTVPERLHTGVFLRTLQSLQNSGFDQPRIFVDGIETDEPYRKFGLPITIRNPKIRTFGNWILGLWELYIRVPDADRYAMFQDDFVTGINLRKYLEACPSDEKRYWNLLTFPQNQGRVKPDQIGWFRSNGMGLGAVALVFTREQVVKLLCSRNHIVSRPMTKGPKSWKSIDGGIVSALKKLDIHEYCHNPSLVFHTGEKSSMGNKKFDDTPSFQGEDFDYMTLKADPETQPTPVIIKPPKKFHPKKRHGMFRFEEALSYLPENPFIVELGAPRDPRPVARAADGHSTVVWNKYSTQVHTVDIDPKALEITKQLCPQAQVFQRDGVAYVQELLKPVQLLYLDGPDARFGGAEFTLKALQSAKLAPECVVLIDDVDDDRYGTPQGKSSSLVSDWLKAHGFLEVPDTLPYHRQLLAVRGSLTPRELPAVPTPSQASKVALRAPKTSRIGLVGYNTNTGLGTFNWQAATYLEIDQWLVKPNKAHGTKSPHPDVDTTVCPTGNEVKLNRWLDRIDTLLFFETPYYRDFAGRARRKGKRIVCVPMLEWTPDNRNNWTSQVDLFICPTRISYETLKAEGLPCTYVDWPTDTEHFKNHYRERKRCEKFLFIHGKGGFGGRKGGAIVRQAKELWPEMPLIVRSQSGEQWPEGTEIIKPGKTNVDLFDQGDVLLCPHHLDGYGLEPVEAMICGMPVITPDAPPWNENPALVRIEVSKTTKQIRRPMPWVNINPRTLVNICQSLLGEDILEHSHNARRWALERSWNGREAEFTELVRNGVPD